MKIYSRSAACAALLAIVTMLPSAEAQVPPHQPGAICFTPSFWCWMPYPGFPGQGCFCTTPRGPIAGHVG